MTLRWKLYAFFFKHEYDLLFDVMTAERFAYYNLTEEMLTPSVEKYYAEVFQLGVQMGIWTEWMEEEREEV